MPARPRFLTIEGGKDPVIYLDHNATTPVLPEVARRMAEVAEQTPLNPSSAHRAGGAAREVLLSARESLADLLSCQPEQVTFTSSGTEANNAALWHGAADGAIVTTNIEHSSILAAAEHLEAQGIPVYYAEVDANGLITAEAVAEQLDSALAKGCVGLVSVQWANNETGVIQPIEQIADICRQRGVPIHVDAAQAVGKLPIELDKLPIDFLTLTGHKFHGPTGVGALYIREQIRHWLFGGAQESGRRPGTENLIGIAGLGSACEARRRKFPTVNQEIILRRNDFEAYIFERFPWVKINGARCSRIGNTSNIHFIGLDGQAIMAQLDVAGVCVSQSSACTNHKPTPSYVLRAMGLSEAEAYASIRFSFAETNTREDVDQTISELSHIVDRLSALERLA